jgi:hypothetical protein
MSLSSPLLFEDEGEEEIGDWRHHTIHQQRAWGSTITPSPGPGPLAFETINLEDDAVFSHDPLSLPTSPPPTFTAAELGVRTELKLHHGMLKLQLK